MKNAVAVVILALLCCSTSSAATLDLRYDTVERNGATVATEHYRLCGLQVGGKSGDVWYKHDSRGVDTLDLGLSQPTSLLGGKGSTTLFVGRDSLHNAWAMLFCYERFPLPEERCLIIKACYKMPYRGNDRPNFSLAELYLLHPINPEIEIGPFFGWSKTEGKAPVSQGGLIAFYDLNETSYLELLATKVTGGDRFRLKLVTSF